MRRIFRISVARRARTARGTRLVALLVVTGTGLFIALCADAQAFKACANKSNRHCYAITNWEMIDGETVLGGSIKIDTISYGVPEYGAPEPNFLTNEEWAGFDAGKHWIESGQIAEYGKSFQYFWDYFNHAGFSTIYESCCAVSPAWNTYKMQYDNGRLSIHAWDVYINGEYMGFGEGLELEAKELKAGLETTSENNEDSGETAYAEALGTDGLWWTAWEASGVGNYAKPEERNYAGEPWQACVFDLFPASEGLHGDIYFGNKPCGDNGPAVLRAASFPRRASSLATVPISGGSLSDSQIREVAMSRSDMAGDGSPAAMTVAEAPRGRALAVALPGGQVAPSAEAATDVIEIHGHFTARLVPPGQEPPSGSVMTVAIDAQTGEVLGEHIGNESVAMSSLGETETLQ